MTVHLYNAKGERVAIDSPIGIIVEVAKPVEHRFGNLRIHIKGGSLQMHGPKDAPAISLVLDKPFLIEGWGETGFELIGPDLEEKH